MAVDSQITSLSLALITSRLSGSAVIIDIFIRANRIVIIVPEEAHTMVKRTEGLLPKTKVDTMRRRPNLKKGRKKCGSTLGSTS